MRSTIRRLAVVAATFVTGLAVAAAPAHAAPQPEFLPGSVTGLSSTSQAGAHPDFSTTFALTRDADDNPTTAPRNVTADLPRGLLGNPLATPTCPFPKVKDPLGSGPGPCPRNTAVGEVTFTLRVVDEGYDWGPFTALLYNVPPSKGQPAAFGFFALVQPVRLDMSIEPDGEYNVRTSLADISEAQPLISTDVTLWGVPADHQGPGDRADYLGQSYGGPLAGEPRRPFLNNPSVCDGRPLATVYNAVPWDPQGKPAVPATGLSPALTGCDQQVFEPTIDVRPSTREAGAPSGYEVDLSVPQNEDPDGLATPPLRDLSLTLPPGTAISPGVADGLEACSDAQLGLGSKSIETCPLAAKIGTAEIDSPVLDGALTGSLYLGTQLSSDPGSGQMFRVFLTAEGAGTRIKLRGEMRADDRTGQLTTSFEDNPQLPLSRLSLRFKGGDRAPLVNPSTCGTHTATGSSSSWGGQRRELSSSFTLDEGCPTGRFAPTFAAGTTNPLGGQFSPFVATVGLGDADQRLERLTLALPPGLLGALGSVPLCPDAQVATGTCTADTRVGSTTVVAGAGGAPLSLPGTVSLGGPYKGAPFSLNVAVRAKAGPFDLGLVVVRAALHVDARDATATAVTDPFPTVVGGVPLELRRVSIVLDRPGFMFNGTSCAATTIGGTFHSVGGAVATTSAGYQPKGCSALKLEPELSLRFTGRSELRQGRHPGVQVQMGSTFGQTNLRTIALTLPLVASLDARRAETLCEAADAAARNCPRASQIGWASAATTMLHQPVQGPVYFVKGTRILPDGRAVESLPKLYVKLSGEGVSIDLHADSDVDGKGRLVTTFTDLPDVSFRDFRLTLNNGKHGILQATSDVCGADKGTSVAFTGHNGGTTRRSLRFTAPDCKPQLVSATNSGNTRLAVRVGGVGGGSLALTGPGLAKVTRTVRRSDTAMLRSRLSPATSRLLRQGRSVRVAVRVAYVPRAGARTPAGERARKLTIRRTVTIRGVRG